MKKDKTSKVKFSTALLWIVLVLSILHFALLMLGLFGVVSPSFLDRAGFNYIVSFVLVILCLVMYIILMVVEKKKSLVIPEWFKIVFYVGFFVFTNVYYYFGLYATLAGLIVFYIYLSIVLNILALSVFFNTQKSENNVLKTTNTFTALSTCAYAISAGAMLETIISAFKIIFAKNSTFSTLSMFIIDMCIIILVSVIMAIIYYGSLSKQKIVINKCLIKYYK